MTRLFALLLLAAAGCMSDVHTDDSTLGAAGGSPDVGVSVQPLISWTSSWNMINSEDGAYIWQGGGDFEFRCWLMHKRPNTWNAWECSASPASNGTRCTATGGIYEYWETYNCTTSQCQIRNRYGSSITQHGGIKWKPRASNEVFGQFKTNSIGEGGTSYWWRCRFKSTPDSNGNVTLQRGTGTP